MLKGLAEEGHEITYLSINTNKHYADRETIQQHFGFLKSVIPFDIDTSIKPLSAFFNLFSSKSYNIERFYKNGFAHTLQKTLQNNAFDIVHFEGLYVAKYIHIVNKFGNTSTLLRQHNIEYKIWERLADKTNNPLRKFYLNLLAKRLKHFEKDIVQYFNAVIPIATTDEREMTTWTKMPYLKTIHTGFDTSRFQSTDNTPTLPNSIYHIGSMEWLPNQQAMEWFHTSVWPLLTKAMPSVQFFMAGKNMPAHYNQWESENFRVKGEVGDVSQFASDKQLLVVPLLSASGIRIKTIEAMLQNKIVVSTSLGAEGLPVKNKEHCMIADTAQDFANAIIHLFNHPDERAAMILKARQAMVENFDLKHVSKQWTALYQHLLG